MPLRIKCPTGHVLIVPDNRVGRELRCPRCDQPFIVPEVDKKLSRQTGKVPTASPSSSSLDLGNLTTAPPPGKAQPAVQATASPATPAAQSPPVKTTSARTRGKESQPSQPAALTSKVPIPPLSDTNEPRAFPPRKPAPEKSPAATAAPTLKVPIPNPTAPPSKPPAQVNPPTAATRQPTPSLSPAPPAPTSASPPPEPTPAAVKPIAGAESTPAAVSPAQAPSAEPSKLAPDQTSPTPPPASTLPADTAIAIAPRKLPVKPPQQAVTLGQAPTPVPPRQVEAPPKQGDSPAPPPPAASPPPVTKDDHTPSSEQPKQRHGVIHGRDKRLAVYQLGAAMIAAALFSMIPGAWDVVEHLTIPDSPYVARWAFVLLTLGLVQIAYSVYLIQLPDWTTVWVITLYALAMAAIYAMAFGLTLIASTDGTMVRALQIEEKVAGGQAALWCLCMASLFTLLAFFAGRMSVRWHRAELVLHSVGLAPGQPQR